MAMKLQPQDNQEEEAAEGEGLPTPMPPGQPDDVMGKMEVLSGLRRSPGPMATGAGNNHLIQALNAILVASQLDPGAGERLRDSMSTLTDIIAGSRGLMAGPVGPDPMGGDTGVAGKLMAMLGSGSQGQPAQQPGQ